MTLFIIINLGYYSGVTHGLTVIILGNGLGKTCSNLGWSSLHFISHLNPSLVSLAMGKIVGLTRLFSLDMETGLQAGKGTLLGNLPCVASCLQQRGLGNKEISLLFWRLLDMV